MLPCLRLLWPRTSSLAHHHCLILSNCKCVWGQYDIICILLLHPDESRPKIWRLCLLEITCVCFTPQILFCHIAWHFSVSCRNYYYYFTFIITLHKIWYRLSSEIRKSFMELLIAYIHIINNFFTT